MLKEIAYQFFKANNIILIFQFFIRFILVIISLIYILTVAEFGEVRAIYEAY